MRDPEPRWRSFTERTAAARHPSGQRPRLVLVPTSVDRPERPHFRLLSDVVADAVLPVIEGGDDDVPPAA